jgi:feruloyl esterase
VTSAKLAPGDSSHGVPAYCEVVATVSPEAGSKIGVVVRLPTNWNGKVLALGGGGFAGNVTLPAAAEGLARGYATLQTDTGHASAVPFDTSWAVTSDGSPNRIALEDLGFRAVHEMAVVGKQIVGAYYGRAQRYAYFQGCSQGGHQGLTETQRYPDDFDGIIAGAPASMICPA